jgi:hypothetical protein
LDAPGRNIEQFQFLGKRWVTTLEGNTLPVFSAEDGRLLARLTHPDGESYGGVEVSPSGHSIAMHTHRPEGGALVREWDVETWQPRTITSGVRGRYWTDDALGGESVFAGEYYNMWTVYRLGRNEPIAVFPGPRDWLLGRAGDLAHGGNGWVYDTRTWQRLLPPPGRKFHPDLARFAPDGRFVVAGVNFSVSSFGERCVIDTRTDKFLPTEVGWTDVVWRNLPGFGLVAVLNQNGGAGTVEVRLLPSASRLDLPADLLELWAQVAVCGEIGGDGQFLKWDESTWERKRQELAARPAPWPDFPFPGHVAADRLHWLRTRYASASDADRPHLARQLLDRAESAGDRAEAVRWRAILTPQPSPTKPAAKP